MQKLEINLRKRKIIVHLSTRYTLCYNDVDLIYFEIANYVSVGAEQRSFLAHMTGLDFDSTQRFFS